MLRVFGRQNFGTCGNSFASGRIVPGFRQPLRAERGSVHGN